MSEDEKVGWVYFLWSLSVLTLYGLGVVTGGGHPGLMFGFGIPFVVIFAAWLFRITYLAGARR